MSVFVGVEMRWVDSSILELLDLSEGFAANVLFVDFASQEGLKEVDE